MIETKIDELKIKVEEARKQLLKELNDKYAYCSHIAESAQEFIILYAQLEYLQEELEED